MEHISNNSPRFIEVFCTYVNPHIGVDVAGDLDYEFINWSDIIETRNNADGWIILILLDRKELIESAYDNREHEVVRPIFHVWVKEDFAHFVRRVNKGLPITMIKDGDE